MRKEVIRAIFVRVGEDPVVFKLPAERTAQREKISDLLEGNFGATEFFYIVDAVSLFILTNDLSVPLRLKANRRFPGKDSDEIIFGNAIFIAAYNDISEHEGAIDMPKHISEMFVEEIKLNFAPCNGDEQPTSKDEVYTDNEGTPEEHSYKWVEIDKPDDIEGAEFIAAGRAKWYSFGEKSVLSINGRYFRQVAVTPNTPLN